MTIKPKTRKAAAVTSVSTLKLTRGLSERRLSDGTAYFVGKVLAKSATRENCANDSPADNRDPIFALIDAHKARTKEWLRIYDKLDEAEFEARKTHGRRPWELIAWRNHSAIGE